MWQQGAVTLYRCWGAAPELGRVGYGPTGTAGARSIPGAAVPWHQEASVPLSRWGAPQHLWSCSSRARIDTCSVCPPLVSQPLCEVWWATGSWGCWMHFRSPHASPACRGPSLRLLYSSSRKRACWSSWMLYFAMRNFATSVCMYVYTYIPYTYV